MKDLEVIEQLDLVALEVINELKERGVVIQRYNSFSTNSIYLKFDLGVANSLRISDHKGKKHLSYRYNILTCCPQTMKSNDKNGFIRYYFPPIDTELAIKKILYDRSERIEKYGWNNYRDYMVTNQKIGQQKRGFWESAWIV